MQPAMPALLGPHEEPRTSHPVAQDPHGPPAAPPHGHAGAAKPSAHTELLRHGAMSTDGTEHPPIVEDTAFLESDLA